MISKYASRRVLPIVLLLSLIFLVSDVYASRIISHKIESTALAKNIAGILSLRNILIYCR